MIPTIIRQIVELGYSHIPYNQSIRNELAVGMIFYHDNKWQKLKEKDRFLYCQRFHIAENKRMRSLDRTRKSIRNQVKQALKTTLLVQEPCIVCGNANTAGHHWDYTKPLDVIWYCQTCHNQLHRNLEFGGISDARRKNPYTVYSSYQPVNN